MSYYHKLSRCLSVVFVLGLSSPLLAAPVKSPADVTTAPVVRLWPGAAPGSLGSADADTPTLSVYLAAPDIATGAAIVVCPGGGYHSLAPSEGKDYALWLNEMGISAFVLKYRLGSAGYHHPAMLNDAARALRLVRAHAAEYNIDQNRVGIIGSSAGGHLASTLLTHFDAGDAQSTDTIEQQSSRPDLGILCYPVITMGSFTHKGSHDFLLGDHPQAGLEKLLSNEEQVTTATPETFIFATSDDKVVPVQNSLLFGTALANAGVAFELHIYPYGRHGIGLGSFGKWEPARRHPWTKACAAWLRSHNFAR